ncbi:hypothetical protein BDP27DRAFT_1445210 [Rhodocollybia butyracea]|uniref:Uncharacterized protein n=1 Tax=Rhodocollybia butyracea TaxID=206335 RepID=A0A9P5UAR1_9AGAR|nr:hypothetical protein BDP27DRAFT_1445210 [Rhodocollybia butyracea]
MDATLARAALVPREHVLDKTLAYLRVVDPNVGQTDSRQTLPDNTYHYYLPEDCPGVDTSPTPFPIVPALLSIPFSVLHNIPRLGPMVNHGVSVNSSVLRDGDHTLVGMGPVSRGISTRKHSYGHIKSSTISIASPCLSRIIPSRPLFSFLMVNFLSTHHLPYTAFEEDEDGDVFGWSDENDLYDEEENDEEQKDD